MGLFGPKQKDCDLRKRLEELEAKVEKLMEDHETLKRNKEGYHGAMRQIQAIVERCRKCGCTLWETSLIAKSKGQWED